MLKAYKIGIVFFSFVAILLIIAAIMPKKVTIERSKVMSANPTAVFEQVNNLKNWPNWVSWIRQDSTVKITYGAITEGVNASYYWSNANKSVGSIRITESNPNNTIITEVQLGNMSPSEGKWTLESTSEGTIVTQSKTLNLNYPFTILGPMLDDATGSSLETELQNLNNYVSN